MDKLVRGMTFLFLALLPSYVLRFELFGFPTTFLEIFFLILGMSWFAARLHDRGSFLFLKTWWLPLALLFAAATIGLFVSPEPIAAVGIWKAYFVEPMLFFVILRTSLRDFDDAEKALLSLGAGAFAVAAFAIFQSVSGLGIPPPWDVEGRVTSVYPYPNAVGLYLSPIMLLGLCALHRSVAAKFNLRVCAWLVVLAASLVAIVLSKTEAAWVSLPVAFLLAFGLFVKKYRPVTIGLLVVLAFLSLSIPMLREKILLQDYSGEVRRKQWTETVVMLNEYWLTGAGLSGYPVALAPYHQLEEIEIFQYPHNIFLNVWSELGLLGLLALCVLAWQTWRQTKKAFAQTSRFRWLAFGCFAALLQMTIHGLVDAPFFKNDLAMLTLALLALLSWSVSSPYAYPEPQKIS